MDNSLRQKATSGVIWSAYERFGQQGAAFIVQLILARLLAPEQFGLIAMVVVFIAISSVLIDAGFSRALIQRKEVSDSDLSTVFYFNLMISVVLAGVLYALAPAIASFYDQSELAVILRFLCLGLVVSAFGVVHQSILTRNLLFKKIFWTSFPSALISGILGITLAIQGYGVWSLVAQMLSQRIIVTLFLWFQSGWRPSLSFDFAALKEMFPYGARLAIAGVLDQGFKNLYVLVIGKFFAPIEVAYFQRARSFQQLPISNVQTVISRVAFPLFSSIQNDPERLKRGMRKGLQLICLCAFPGMALLAGISEPLVVVLIGDQWLACVPYLQWLCLVGAMYPLHSLNLNLLSAIGRADLFLRLEVIKKVLIVVNIAVTFQFGVQAMIYGMVITTVLGLMLNAYYTKIFIEYSLSEQLRDVLSTVCVSLAIWLSAFVMTHVLDVSITPILSLLASGGLGVVIFAAGIRFLNNDLKLELRGIFNRVPFGDLLERILL